MERAFPNSGHGTGKGDAHKASTVPKCVLTDNFHRIRNVHACKAGAFKENTSSDDKNRVGDSDACKAGTISEYIKY